MRCQEMLREAMGRMEAIANVETAFQRVREMDGGCLQKATHLAALLIKAGVKAYVAIFLPPGSSTHHAVTLITDDGGYTVVEASGDSLFVNKVRNLEEFEEEYGPVVLLCNHVEAHIRGRGLLTYARISRVA